MFTFLLRNSASPCSQITANKIANLARKKTVIPAALAADMVATGFGETENHELTACGKQQTESPVSQYLVVKRREGSDVKSVVPTQLPHKNVNSVGESNLSALGYTPNTVLELLPHCHCVGANLIAPWCHWGALFNLIRIWPITDAVLSCSLFTSDVVSHSAQFFKTRMFCSQAAHTPACHIVEAYSFYCLHLVPF